MTKEQENCMFCHNRGDLNDTTNSDFQVYVDTTEEGYPQLRVSCDADPWWGDDSMLINYCPKCGRELDTVEYLERLDK